MNITDQSDPPNIWHLNGKPFDVQAETTRRAIGKDAYGLYLDMGCGKTASTLNLFVDAVIRGQVDGLVVVCPNSLKPNWLTECEKWGVKAHTYMWPDVPKKLKDIKTPFVLTINYEAIGVGRGEEWLESLMKLHNTMLALDESVAIKNPKSLRTKAALRLRKLAKKRLILSGLPMPQGPHDMWAQLTFLDAIPRMSFFPFKNTFCAMGGFMGKQIIGAQNEEWLNQIINESGFRARKEDWLDLPEKSYSTRPLEMTKLQKQLYAELENDLYTYIAEKDEEVSTQLVITKLIKLQQIASGFVITDSGSIVELDGGSPKMKEIGDIMEQTSSKVLVPVVFKRSIDLLLEFLKGYGVTYIRGGMQSAEIEEQKDKFNNYKEFRVCIVQMDSAKYGHTLIGSEKAGYATITAFYENTFSLDARSQMEARIHRAGQKMPCTMVDFALNPIDNQIVAALQRKQEVSAAIIDGIRMNKKKD